MSAPPPETAETLVSRKPLFLPSPNIFRKMLTAFESYMAQNRLLQPGERALLAVSGGVDSMAMCRLFQLAKRPFAVAHCNFQLRGAASVEDEAFVAAWAKAAGVPFYSVRFATADFAEKNKLSIQEAARKLRYEWLFEIAQQADCQRIATAHHLDDSLETALYNFVKGCGLRGLHGILPARGNRIRPLLFATKRQVSEFAVSENLEWREDASNLTDKYNRNKIRRYVMPVLEGINPAFQTTGAATLKRLREAEALYDFALRQLHATMVKKEGDLQKMDTTLLLASPAPATVLYEWLKPFGFNRSRVENILQSLENQPGSVFESPGFRLWTDRRQLVLAPVKAVSNTHLVRTENDVPLALEDGIFTLQIAKGIPVNFASDPFTAYLDADRVQFPLTLRRWRAGDSFCPLGMGGKHQKLQDFFSGRKLSVPEKERVWLLESGGEVCWVVGMRLDERFKVAAGTKQHLAAHFEPGTFAVAL
jgi:tRNA(Ile)-lysidine synthase